MHTLLAALLLVLVWAAPAPGQPFDTACANNSNGASSVSCNLTVGALSQGIVIIDVATLTLATANTPTLNGSAAGVTQHGSTLTHADGPQLRRYYKIAPSSGATACAVSFTAAVDAAILCQSFANANQSSPLSTSVTAGTGAFSTAPSVTITTTTGQVVVDGVMWNSADGTRLATVGTNQTAQANSAPGGTNAGIAASRETAVTSSVPMTWTLGSASQWLIVANVLNAASTDTQAPTAPSSLNCAAATTTQINCQWSPSTDNVGVTGYRIERCQGSGCSGFAEIAQPGSTSYNDVGLTSGLLYRYRTRAGDAAGNLSGYSNIAEATTLVGQTVNLAWTNPATDETSVEVERCCGAACQNFSAYQTLPPDATSTTDSDACTPVAGYRTRNIKTGAAPSAYSNIRYTTPGNPPAILQVVPTALTYNATVGASDPPGQTVAITNAGVEVMNWTVSSNAAWLTCAPTAGANNGQTTCTVDITPGPGSTGTHFATITITAAGATGSPQAVAVTLNLSPATVPGGTTPGTGRGGRVR